MCVCVLDDVCPLVVLAAFVCLLAVTSVGKWCVTKCSVNIDLRFTFVWDDIA